MLQVNWVKSTTGTWLPLETVDLSNVTASGVYYIWHAGNPGRTVRIGQGDIKSRVSAHRIDQAILKFATNGNLLVTWAAVPAFQQDGVERFLANHYKPLVGDAFPDVVPIPVNLVA
jgi:hypothetical protein